MNDLYCGHCKIHISNDVATRWSYYCRQCGKFQSEQLLKDMGYDIYECSKHSIEDKYARRRGTMIKGCGVLFDKNNPICRYFHCHCCNKWVYVKSGDK
jgi:hypothetical protein